MKSYIKEAERSALNMCKYYSDMIQLIDDMEYGMISRTDDYRLDDPRVRNYEKALVSSAKLSIRNSRIP